MEEWFRDLWVPEGTAELKEIKYTHGQCAMGCWDCKDYERVGCVSNGITQIECKECLCYQDNQLHLNDYLETKKVWLGYYKGLVVPAELTKETCDGVGFYMPAQGIANCGIFHMCQGKRMSCLDADAEGNYKSVCQDCICNIEHKKELEELIKMWKEEDNPIKPGMVVKYNDTEWLLVFEVHEECVHGWWVGDNVSQTCRNICELGDYIPVTFSDIQKVYQSKFGMRPSGIDIYKLTGNFDDWENFWEEVQPPVLELTVADIEKKYGRKVKIVGGKK